MCAAPQRRAQVALTFPRNQNNPVHRYAGTVRQFRGGRMLPPIENILGGGSHGRRGPSAARSRASLNARGLKEPSIRPFKPSFDRSVADQRQLLTIRLKFARLPFRNSTL